MSTINSSTDHLTLNADGASKDIKFQANGVEKASISSAGAFTSTTIDATVLTGTLPAIDGGSLTNLPAGGITEADSWKLTSGFNVDSSTTLSSNVSRSTYSGFNKLGTGMSLSGGVFTFPSTGYWHIGFHAQWNKDGTSRYLNHTIKPTTDGTNHTNGTEMITQIGSGQASTNYASAYTDMVFDVTNTSTHKVLFSVFATNSCTLTWAYMTFTKLGET